MRTVKIITIFISIIILCITIIITTHLLSNKDIQNIQYNKYKVTSDRFIENFNAKNTDFIQYTIFGINYINLFNIFDNSFIDFINLSVVLRNNNELRIHYFVTELNRIAFENKLSQNINKEIKITSLNELGNLVPVALKDRYCPITYITPNITTPIYNYIGLDICNNPSFSNIINALNNTREVQIIPRKSLYSENIVLDIGLQSINGISILSITLVDLIKQINHELILNNNAIIYYKENIIYNDCVDSCKNTLIYRRQVKFNNNTDYILQLHYPIENTFNILSLLVGLSLLIFIIICGVISFIIWEKKKKTDELEKYQFASEMLGYVNHEIRNPLNSIQGLINISIYDLQQILLERHPDLNLVISNLSTAENSCELLNHIVNDILDIKKIQENKLKINYQPLSLKLFEKDLYKTISLKLNEKPHISYNYNLHNDLDFIITDRHRLLQIMINFISNALKFTEKGSVTIDIRKEIINEINYVNFSVTDTGRGIANDKKEMIFQPYSQVEVLDSLRGSGVGLGLHLCKMITGCFGGIIGFNSIENKESTFYVKLKLIIPE
jgi:signal transduction histidine kinase